MKKTSIVMALTVSLSFLSGVTIAGDLSNENIGRTIGVTCMGCHGSNGVSKGSVPSLKGRDAAELSVQLKAFKSGTRPATIMGRIAKGYSDSDIDATAKYFSNLK